MHVFGPALLYHDLIWTNVWFDRPLTMPPKTWAPDAQLPLQEWLKVLTGRGVEMRVAMSLAGKMCVSSISNRHG